MAWTLIGAFLDEADPRLSDARTPLAHAPSHNVGGADDLSGYFVPWVNVGAPGGVPEYADPRMSDARAPTAHGHAGSDITSGTVAYARLPVGTLVNTVAAGNDARLSDARTPTAHGHVGTDITSGTVPYARLPVGTAASTVAAGDDSRLTNARTPTAHASTHAAGGSDPIGRTTVAKSANYTLTDSDDVVIFNTASGALTATLPTAVGRAGKLFIVKKLGGATANPLTIASNGGTIDTAATEVISVAGGFRELISDGTNWHIISGKVEPIIVSAGNFANGTTWTIDASIGSIYRANATGAGVTLAVPTNPIDGDSITIELHATAATSITLNASILLTAGITGPIAVPIGKKWFGGLRYVTGVGWFLLASTVQS